jgi:hypothetical protein
MTITDEMVEIAKKAMDARVAFIHLSPSGLGTSGFVDNDAIRAALTAVAPMLIARGMREAAKIVLPMDDWGTTEISDTILARAQELDPR